MLLSANLDKAKILLFGKGLKVTKFYGTIPNLIFQAKSILLSAKFRLSFYMTVVSSGYKPRLLIHFIQGKHKPFFIISTHLP